MRKPRRRTWACWLGALRGGMRWKNAPANGRARSRSSPRSPIRSGRSPPREAARSPAPRSARYCAELRLSSVNHRDRFLSGDEDDRIVLVERMILRLDFYDRSVGKTHAVHHQRSGESALGDFPAESAHSILRDSQRMRPQDNAWLFRRGWSPRRARHLKEQTLFSDPEDGGRAVHFRRHYHCSPDERGDVSADRRVVKLLRSSRLKNFPFFQQSNSIGD